MWLTVSAPDSKIRMMREFFSPPRAATLLADLLETVPWRQDRIRSHGKEHTLPRLQQFYGDAGLTYSWSGVHLDTLPWSSVLAPVRRLVEIACGATFNTALVNYYRDGDDTIGWHSDDEPELGENPTIASISVGAEREFLMRHRSRDDKLKIPLPSGSLLVMSGATQKFWAHSIPRRKGISDPRINVTFRSLKPTEPT